MEHRDTKAQSVIFLRERSSRNKSLALWPLLTLSIYFSVSPRLRVQYKGLHRFFAIHF